MTIGGESGRIGKNLSHDARNDLRMVRHPAAKLAAESLRNAWIAGRRTGHFADRAKRPSTARHCPPLPVATSGVGYRGNDPLGPGIHMLDRLGVEAILRCPI